MTKQQKLNQIQPICVSESESICVCDREGETECMGDIPESIQKEAILGSKFPISTVSPTAQITAMLFLSTYFVKRTI
jgi:hypothetical protein